MKASFRSGLIALILLAVMLPGACKREVIKKDAPALPCQIKRIAQKMPGTQDRIGEFTYNSFGDPIAFTPLQHRSGSVKYEFRYDKDRRLTDYIAYYPTIAAPPQFEFWRKFIYDDKGRIIRDTAYKHGLYGAELTTYHRYKVVTNYQYDNQQRVSRRVWRQLLDNVPDGNMGDYKYDYNEQGNLVTPGAVYDNKVSVYSLHKIWMFLNCNYSKNNLVQATGYNSYGLPLGFGGNTQQGVPMGMLTFLGLGNCEIEYQCK